MTTNGEELWEGLKPPTVPGDLDGRTPPDRTEDDVKAAVDHLGRLHLLIEADEDDTEITETPIRGLNVTLDTLRVGDREPARYHDLSCADEALVKNFLVLVKDVLNEIDSGPPRAVIISVLRRWRRFWSNRPGELSDEEIIGLFGELWFLEHWIGPPSLSAVQTWFGPDRNRHDFIWPAATVEVKATRAHSDGAATHAISSGALPPGVDSSGRLFL